MRTVLVRGIMTDSERAPKRKNDPIDAPIKSQPKEGTNAPDAKKRVRRVLKPGSRNAAPGASRAQEKPASEDSTFVCVQCGAVVPKSKVLCPICGVPAPGAVAEKAEQDLGGSLEDEFRMRDETDGFLGKDSIPYIHFDAETGKISCLEDDVVATDAVLECSNCGAGIEFETEECPICGTKLDVVDKGIVGLFSDASFDDYAPGELDCPLCGEHVCLVEGSCPECGEVVLETSSTVSSEKVDPIIHSDNVVFLHLDVESGELSFLQKSAKRLGFEQMTVRLGSAGG